MRDFPTVDVYALMTPWKRALRVTPGVIDESLVRDMESLDFDYAPVMDERKSIGVVPRSRLEDLSLSGLLLASEDEAIIRVSVPGEPELDEVLALIEEHGVCSVGIGTVAGDCGLGGMISLSDLNKHHFRASVYPLFAELETALALLAEAHFVDPWLWLSRLDKDKQARLVGYWELAKRDRIDIGPLAGTTLSELSKIVGGAEALRTPLGFPSKGKWDDFVGGLVDLRNSVMHPVRPLFTSPSDFGAVHEQLSKVLVLVHRLEELRGE